MKLQKFIDRPILSMVISVVILVAGLIGLYALSVEQYPDIAPPTIRVSTTYSGANAEAVQKSVIVPLGCCLPPGATHHRRTRPYSLGSTHLFYSYHSKINQHLNPYTEHPSGASEDARSDVNKHTGLPFPPPFPISVTAACSWSWRLGTWCTG